MIYLAVIVSLIMLQLKTMFYNDRYYKFERITYILTLCIIFFLAAMRKGIGYDFSAYKNIYEQVKLSQSGLLQLSSNWNFEVGYLLLNRISPSFEFLIFFVAVISVIPKLVIINKFSDAKYVAILMYFTGVYLNFDMGVIRQGISISFFFVSLIYLLENKVMLYLVINIIGAFFHFSSLIFLPLCLFKGNKIPRKTMYLITIAVFLFSFINISEILVFLANILPFEIVSEKVQYYSSFNTGNITTSLIKRIVILIGFIEVYRWKNIDDSKSLLFLNGYFLSVIFMGLFSSIGIIGGRGSTGLYLLQIFIFSKILVSFKNIYMKVLILFLVLGLSVISMFNLFSHGSLSNQPYLPYESILFNN